MDRFKDQSASAARPVGGEQSSGVSHQPAPPPCPTPLPPASGAGVSSRSTPTGKGPNTQQSRGSPLIISLRIAYHQKTAQPVPRGYATATF